MSVGGKFDGDPTVFKVVDGKLYLNLNKEFQEKWEKDVIGHISKANEHWKRIRDVAPSDLK